MRVQHLDVVIGGEWVLITVAILAGLAVLGWRLRQNSRTASAHVPEESPPNPIPLLIVDYYPGVVKAVTDFLEEYDDLRVVGVVEDPAEALTQAKALQPKVVLIEALVSPLRFELTGAEVIRRLRAELPGVGIIATAALEEKTFWSAIPDAGADAFIPKWELGTRLVPAIRRVAQPAGLTQRLVILAARLKLALRGSPGEFRADR